MYSKGILWKQCTSKNALSNNYFRVTLFGNSSFQVYKLKLHAVLFTHYEPFLIFPPVEHSKKQSVSVLTTPILVQIRHNTKPRKKAVETPRRARDITSETHQHYANTFTLSQTALHVKNPCFMNQNKFRVYSLSISWCYGQRSWLVHQLSLKWIWKE